MKAKKSLLIILPLLIISFEIKANCEAGGYSIHTVATYNHDLGREMVFLRVDEKTKRLTKINSSLNVKTGDLVAGPLRTKNIDGCEQVRILPVKGVDLEYDQFKFKVSGCDELTEHKYIRIDLEKREVSIPKSLKLKRIELAGKESSRIEAIVKKTDFKITSSGSGGVIPKSEIENLNNLALESTQVGTGEKPFVMTIAKLKLKNIAEIYSKDDINGYGFVTKEEIEKLQPFAIYPTIFFSRGDQLELIGDGSWCSEMSLASIKNEDFKLGGEVNLERFVITNAFDITGDNEPEVIEVNGSWTYFVGDGVLPEVIDVQQYGC